MAEERGPWSDFAPDGYDAERGVMTVNIGGKTPDEEQFERDIEADAPWAQFDGSDIAVTPSEKRDPSFGQQAMRGLELSGRSLMNAAGGTADLVTLPISALMNLFGANIPPYREITDEAATDLGFAAPETTWEKIVSAASEYGAAGLGLSGLARGGAKVFTGLTGDVLETLGRSPTLDAVGGAGGGVGQTIAEESGAGPIGQTIGAAAGGLTAGGIATGVPAATRRITQSVEPSELLAAFSRQQVTPMADQVGGTGARVSSALSKATLGGIPLAQAAEKSILSARAARDRIAGTMGNVTDETGVGQAVDRGAKSFMTRSEKRAGELYEAIPIAPKRRAVLTNTRQALAEMTQGLESNPELSRLVAENPRLKSYLDALTVKSEPVYAPAPAGATDARSFSSTRQVGSTVDGGQLSWEDLKRFRSIIGEIAGRPSMSSEGDQVAAMKKLYGALSEDMRATATAAGPDAAKAFERANTFWRAREARIENVLVPLLGDDMSKSAESAFRQINSWASSEGKGDFARVAQAMRSLPPDEAATVRASIFSRLGNVSAGRQAGAGDVFSPADFATHWNSLSPRAKAVLFPGKEYQKDLSDIAMIADSMKRSSEFANVSRTALASNGIGLTTMGLMGSPIAAGGIASSQLAVGKLLASERFARWLASAPKKPNGPATLAHINRLTAIGAAEPTIANEVLLLQERLASAFTQTHYRAAASPDEAGAEKEVNQ